MPQYEIMKLGTYLVQKGLLTQEQAQEALEEQQRRSSENPELLGPRFGRVAIDLGYISERPLERAFLDKTQEEMSSG
jgi:hypothetical protein